MSMIKVDYAALENASAQIKGIAGGIESKLGDLKGRLQQITWDGSDAEAYRVHQAKWDQAINDMNQVLAQIGAAVETARGNYQQTESANAGMWG